MHACQAVTRAPMPFPSPPARARRNQCSRQPVKPTRRPWTPLPVLYVPWCFLDPAFSPLRLAIEPHSPRGTVVNGHRSRSLQAVKMVSQTGRATAVVAAAVQ